MAQNLGITQNLASVEQGENLRFWVDVMRTGEELLDKGGLENYQRMICTWVLIPTICSQAFLG